MLKRSEYVVMSLSFVFMLAIFLVISMNYITDSAASNNEIVDKFDSSTHIADQEKLDKDYLIITGDDTVVSKNVIQALNYAKKGYKVSSMASTVNTSDLKGVKAVIVTTSNLGSLGDMIIKSLKNERPDGETKASIVAARQSSTNAATIAGDA